MFEEWGRTYLLFIIPIFFVIVVVILEFLLRGRLFKNINYKFENLECASKSKIIFYLISS